MKDKGKKLPGGTQKRNVMPDGSYSWEQPDSTGVGGWNGYCGQTAMANLLTTYKGVDVTPSDVANAADDWTPGSDPRTLMRAIHALTTDPETYALSIGDQDLSSASPRTPIVVLLHWEGKVFHYVTVVKATSTDVTFNHWGMQQTLSVAEFDRRWSFRDGQTEAWVMGWSPYTSIRKKPAPQPSRSTPTRTGPRPQ